MKFKHTAQVAFQVKDMAAALRFYCDGLGLKQKFTMKFSDAYGFIKGRAGQDGALSPQLAGILAYFKSMNDLPWIVFIETGEHQFLELFYTYDEKTMPDSQRPAMGYQHLCLEVDDIRAMRLFVEKNGITPDTDTNLGPDGSWQFWLHDPDGNKIELMQYTDQSLQLIGKD